MFICSRCGGGFVAGVAVKGGGEPLYPYPLVLSFPLAENDSDILLLLYTLGLVLGVCADLPVLDQTPARLQWMRSCYACVAAGCAGKRHVCLVWVLLLAARFLSFFLFVLWKLSVRLPSVASCLLLELLSWLLRLFRRAFAFLLAPCLCCCWVFSACCAV